MKYTASLAIASLVFCAVASSADPESKASDDAVARVDALRNDGWKVTATYPIFHQIVAFSFPKSFVPSFEQTRGPAYIQESVPHGETVENWSQMITVTGAQGAAMNPKLTPDSLADFIVTKYRSSCPNTFTGMRIPPGELAKYSANVVLIGCGSLNDHGSDHSEVMLLVTLKGDQDYYSVQWAERGPVSPTAVKFDTKTWGARFQQLQPFRLCPRVPGEVAPFPSCIGTAGN
jgi:hypothetical protein